MFEYMLVGMTKGNMDSLLRTMDYYNLHGEVQGGGNGNWTCTCKYELPEQMVSDLGEMNITVFKKYTSPVDEPAQAPVM